MLPPHALASAALFICTLGQGTRAHAQESPQVVTPAPIALPRDLPPPPTPAAKAAALATLRAQASSMDSDASGLDADAQRLAREYEKQQREDMAWRAEAEQVRSEHNKDAALVGLLSGAFGALCIAGGLAFADSKDKDEHEASSPMMLTGAAFLGVGAIAVPGLLLTRPSIDEAPTAPPSGTPGLPPAGPPPAGPPPAATAPPAAMGFHSAPAQAWSFFIPLSVRF
jgi:hypothetical protein